MVGGILMTSASAIVAGSIVLAGNTGCWLQKRGRCARATEPADGQAASAASISTVSTETPAAP